MTLRVALAHTERGSVEIINPNDDAFHRSKIFSFDAVFDDRSSQKLIYQTCAAPIVQSVLEGYNGTIFCYGQTGSGKTHTMEGLAEDPDKRGIMANSFQQVFDHVTLRNDSGETFLVRASYFEIYNEEIRDLLSSSPKGGLELRESPDHGVYVQGLTSNVVKSFADCDRILQSGKKNRSVGATLMNQGSSRSHSIFSLVVECCSRDQVGEEHFRVGKLNLVDLAGSERQSKTGATGNRLVEATKINLSLSALGNVISALVDGKASHVPYRDSKLTRILQDSLGGNTKTLMCANCGPADYNYEETLSTLRYANRAKNIQNKPVINEDTKDAILREYQDEIAKLKEQLERLNNVGQGQAEAKSINPSRGHDTKDVELRRKFKDERSDHFKESLLAMEKLKTENVDANKEVKALEEKLREEERLRKEMDTQRRDLEMKLRDMEAQLLFGGEMATLADRQQAELRRAEQKLALKNEQEFVMTRQLEAKEEENLQLNEKYSSLQEEASSKTEKLRTLWKKYQRLKQDMKDIQAEFQEERSELIDSLREADKTSKLKDLIIESFIPPEFVSMFQSKDKGGSADWDDEKKRWHIPNIEYACNNILKRDIQRTPSKPYNKALLKLAMDIPPSLCNPDTTHGMPRHVRRILEMDQNNDSDEKDDSLLSPYYWFSKDADDKHKKGARTTTKDML